MHSHVERGNASASLVKMKRPAFLFSGFILELFL